MNRRLLLLALSASLVVSSAFAQRRNLPLVDLVDVPVALAAPPTPLSANEVRNAIIAAALASEWDVEIEQDGSLRLTAVRDFDNRLILNAKYSPTAYSLRYVSSENISVRPEGDFRQTGPTPLEVYAREWRMTRSARQPEAKYAVDRVSTIHPGYEDALFALSASIRRHLRWQSTLTKPS